ncbi:UNVERIFIED_CONTAM: hypothetical protein K2H54_057695 [Gekko kuhli]
MKHPRFEVSISIFRYSFQASVSSASCLGQCSPEGKEEAFDKTDSSARKASCKGPGCITGEAIPKGLPRALLDICNQLPLIFGANNAKKQIHFKATSSQV